MAKVMCEQCHKEEATRKCQTDAGIKYLCSSCFSKLLDEVLAKCRRVNNV